MTIVYGRCHEEIGAFNDTKYIVGMLERVRFINHSPNICFEEKPSSILEVKRNLFIRFHGRY